MTFNFGGGRHGKKNSKWESFSWIDLTGLRVEKRSNWVTSLTNLSSNKCDSSDRNHLSCTSGIPICWARWSRRICHSWGTGELLGSRLAGSADSHICWFIKASGICIICLPFAGVFTHLLRFSQLVDVDQEVRQGEHRLHYSITSHQLLSTACIMGKLPVIVKSKLVVL